MGIQIAPEAADFFRQHRSASRRRLLGLTYEFNPASFENQFSSVLDAGVEVDVVFGRSASYGEVPGDTGPKRRYWGANWRGTFHPKVLFLLANREVSIGVGSANLTGPGLGDYLEAWRYFDAQGHNGVLAGFASFLQRAMDRKVLPLGADCEEILAALPKGAVGTKGPVLSTLSGQLIDQVLGQLDRDVRRIDIMSPIHGDAGPVVGHIKRHLRGDPHFSLFAADDIVPKVDGIAQYHSTTG